MPPLLDDELDLEQRGGGIMTETTSAQSEATTQVNAELATPVRTEADADAGSTLVLGSTELLPATEFLSDEDLEQDAIPDLDPGDVLKDRFVIDRVLGRGGMGVVYLARDLRKEETEDRDPYIAVKVLSEDFRRDPRMVVALQRESRKAQSLAHPAIATVYDFDRDGELVYLTMEVLNGDPLDEVIKKHPEGMDQDEALRLTRGLCLGLAYAHNKNIIHSDFKPGNVFLTDEGTTKILDFGIARAAPANTFGEIVARANSSSYSHKHSQITQATISQNTVSQDTVFDAGELGALTPAYASCEMFEGAEPHPADDVYALAVVHYQLLTGEHPFGYAAAPAARDQGLVPKPIPGLKRRHWKAIVKGLSFSRETRSQHAAEFLSDLEGSPRLRFALAASVLLLTATAGYLAYDQSQQAIVARPDVPFSALAESKRAEFTEQISVGDQAAGFNDMHSALSSYVRAYQLHPRNPKAVERIETLVSKLVAAGIASKDPRIIDSLAALIADIANEDDFLRRASSLSTALDSLRKSASNLNPPSGAAQ